ncbi:MAG: hypothetical protein IT440_12625 [Phycisphaeraceae bacterium]|nr:hypothetical protein [Phycisphaeraceae bacterium]
MLCAPDRPLVSGRDRLPSLSQLYTMAGLLHGMGMNLALPDVRRLLDMPPESSPTPELPPELPPEHPPTLPPDSRGS